MLFRFKSIRETINNWNTTFVKVIFQLWWFIPSSFQHNITLLRWTMLITYKRSDIEFIWTIMYICTCIYLIVDLELNLKMNFPIRRSIMDEEDSLNFVQEINKYQHIFQISQMETIHLKITRRHKASLSRVYNADRKLQEPSVKQQKIPRCIVDATMIWLWCNMNWKVKHETRKKLNEPRLTIC